MPASRSAVFRAFSDPGQLAQFWGPEGIAVPSLRWSPQVGAGYRIEMQPTGGEAFYLTGEFREVEPAERLAFTFEWEPPDADDVSTLAELSFRDLGDSTELVFRQGTFKTEARRELHENSWTETFDKLERFLAGR